jgi:rRNA maturation endonuclease Nob1
MATVRRCLGCSATYRLDEHACPECGSHAADTEEKAEAKEAAPVKPKPTRRRRA